MGAGTTEYSRVPEEPLGGTGRPVVQPEQTWLDRPDNHQGRKRSVAASRWTGFAARPNEYASEVAAGCHLLAIALCPMDLTAFAADKLIHEGRMAPGTMRLNEPLLPVRATFRGAYDALHLHIETAAIAECIETGCGRAVPLDRGQPVLDPVIERLAHALIRADDFGGTFGQCYADSIGLAIIARLLGKTTGGGSGLTAPRGSSLPKWRLKRATDYIAAHLSEPIGLAEIAASTGLTRMHFAAQFRTATGMRPHEYLVRQRIERAQRLLATTELPLAQIALEVGFKAQAHFTTVFARIVGQTPHAWRRQHDGFAADPGRE